MVLQLAAALRWLCRRKVCQWVVLVGSSVQSYSLHLVSEVVCIEVVSADSIANIEILRRCAGRRQERASMEGLKHGNCTS